MSIATLWFSGRVWSVVVSRAVTIAVWVTVDVIFILWYKLSVIVDAAVSRIRYVIAVTTQFIWQEVQATIFLEILQSQSYILENFMTLKSRFFFAVIDDLFKDIALNGQNFICMAERLFASGNDSPASR